MSTQSMVSPTPSIGIEMRGPVALVELCRPAKRNALDADTVRGLDSCFAALGGTAKAIVLHAAGDHFSAGLDLSEVQIVDARTSLEMCRVWHRAFERIERGEVPVVAVLKGAVIGGGLELAAATHVRVAERSTFYALPEGQRGIFLGGGGSVRIPRLIGTHRVAEMMLTGRVYSAEDGLALGLSHYLTEPGDGLAKGIELAEKIAANAPMTNFAVLHALPKIAESDPQTGLLMEALVASLTITDPEAQTRIGAFLDKRAKKIGL